MHVLDLGIDFDDTPTWSKVEGQLERPCWNASSCSVVAIPTWKIFTFGGAAGVISETDRQGLLSDETRILDVGQNRCTTLHSHTLSTHYTIHTHAHTPRLGYDL